MKSGRLSVGCFTSPLVHGSLVLMLVVYCEFAVASLLFQSPCGPNKAYIENNLGIAKTADSSGACSMHCLRNDACNSFTYNSGNGRCQLSTGVENVCNMLPTETNSNYYVAVSCTAITLLFLWIVLFQNELIYSNTIFYTR